MAEIVHCKDCIYWKQPCVRLPNGKYRDYFPGEEYVTISSGINVGGCCAKYDPYRINEFPHFMGKNDFCSQGVMRGEDE